MPRLHPLWVSIVLILVACSPESPPTDESANQAPTVWLQAESPTASDEAYSVRFAWGGSDPDGRISHYEFLVAESNDGMIDPAAVAGEWTSVFGDDSTLVFANDPRDPESAAAPTFTFFVRAVDDEMMRSTEPKYISFTNEILLPAVRITVPSSGLGLTPADMPPISTFKWGPVSGRPEPDSVQFALVNTRSHGSSYSQTVNYLRSWDSASEWYPWVAYGIPKGREWTTPPLDFGDYVFAVRGKTAANAINPVLEEPINARRIKVQARISGPTLVVQNPLFGRVISASCDYPITIIDQAANLPTSFMFVACADHYGGTVEAYRYGWDILDLEDPSQWEQLYAPFPGPIVTTPPRSFAFGTHVFSVEAIDNSGFCSRIQVRLNIVRFTGERNLLIVDDYRPDESGQSGWALTNGALPNDAEHDAFWLDMVSDVDEFDPALDMVAVSAIGSVPITTLARYRNIVWSSYSDVDTRVVTDLPYLYRFIQYRASRFPQSACAPTGGVQGEVVTNAIALAMQSGVHVLIAGNHPVQNVVSRVGGVVLRWPMLPLYELEPGSSQIGTQPTYLEQPPGRHGFAYHELSLEAIDFAFLTSQRARLTVSGTNRRYCGITGLRTINALSRRDDSMRSGLPIDPAFPAISLRREAAGAGRLYHPSSQGLDVEVYNPAYFRQLCSFVMPTRGHFEPIYGLVCFDTGEPTYQQPVAFWAGAYAPVTGDFPGAVAARSAVFGFPPVYFNPGEIKPAIEHILFDEWQLPRRPAAKGDHVRAQ